MELITELTHRLKEKTELRDRLQGPKCGRYVWGVDMQFGTQLLLIPIKHVKTNLFRNLLNT